MKGSFQFGESWRLGRPPCRMSQPSAAESELSDSDLPRSKSTNYIQAGVQWEGGGGGGIDTDALCYKNISIMTAYYMATIVRVH